MRFKDFRQWPISNNRPNVSRKAREAIAKIAEKRSRSIRVNIEVNR